ncbi:WD40/YVTN repeat-like containing protein [Gracilaria domingensis]|nr:WD40/YVTN repeat-like containing protein [Gracilaria domingensis]
MPSPTTVPNGSPRPPTSLQASQRLTESRTAGPPALRVPDIEDFFTIDEVHTEAPNAPPPLPDGGGMSIIVRLDDEDENENGSVVSVRSAQDSREPSPSPVIKRRRRTANLPLPKPENKANNPSQEDGANCCTICLEPWTSSGSHQVCCMPCGHLFGYSCIKQWIRGGHSRKRECPTCKTPGRVKDLRYLFGLPSRLAVSDVSEIQRMRDELQREKVAHEITKRKYEETKTLAKMYRKEIRNLSRHGKPSVQTFGHENNPQRGEPVDNVRLVSVHRTAGASVAVAVDQDASYLFNERVPGDGLRHRVGRIDIGRPNVPVHSPHAAKKRINCIEICRHTNRADHRHIAVASTDNSVSILTPNLQHATTLRLPRIPLSCSWLSSRPHLIAVGLISGEVLMYDIRNTSTHMYESVLSRNQGFRAVHSLEEVKLDDPQKSSAVMAASPLGVYGISFDGYVGTPNVYEVKNGTSEDWAPTSFTVSGSMIAVAAKRRGLAGCASQEMGCSLSIYRGLIREGLHFKFGLSLGEPVYISSQNVPFVYCGIVEGNEDCSDTILAYPDKNAQDKLSVWAYKRDTVNGGSRWKGQDVVSEMETQALGNADVKAAAGLRLPPSARISGVPDGSRGVFVSVGGDVIRVFAAGKY